VSPDDPLWPLRERALAAPFVVAQLGQSLDGRIATVTGESQWINGNCALDHVHRLRACVDAVLVGVGTVVADDPRLNVRRVPGRNPARVVLDPRGRLPADCQCMADDGAPRFIIRAEPGPCPPGAHEIVITPSDGIVSPRAILSRLFERGLGRILVEGGARTISTFIAEGCVDRLHVLVAPMLIGSGRPGLELPPITSLGEALRPPTRVHVLEDGDVLFDCALKPGEGA
jgi:diaminohydroxyphosphoribosylaminopyrimidine deaminase / 5-amino-6-(5-phosphoribosylamino)uracil reductase